MDCFVATLLAMTAITTSVIPGRIEDANPESQAAI
jgi:hypothetical protein